MRRLYVAVAGLPILLVAWQASGHHFDGPPEVQTFMLAGPSIGGAEPAGPTAPYLAGSRIAALADGALVIDADSGDLVRTDVAGAPIARLAIGRDAGVLAYDPVGGVAYVADRRGDRIVAVRVGDALSIATTWRTPAEPYGVALTPDRATVLVTTVADRTLVAYEARTGSERWRAPLAREPRGLAVSPDGSRALIAHVGAGIVEEVPLALEECHPVAQHALDGGNVRGSFAAVFLGRREAVVPFSVSVPVNLDPRSDGGGHYGGTDFAPPISQHLAFVGVGASSGDRTRSVSAEIADQQPRALAWDDAHDSLYVAGMGTDSLLMIDHASQIDAKLATTASLTVADERCGPDGVAIAPHGDVLVWCSFSRRVARLAPSTTKHHGTHLARSVGAQLAPSALTAAQHEGMVVFHTADSAIADSAGVACASCHTEGRADGLSWEIEGKTLQTPMLAGRLVGTGPFKWDGAAHDLTSSIHATVHRLGGRGLADAKTSALVAYLEQMPTVRTPTRPADAVARGKTLFESADLGCASCHEGPAYTDQSKHRLAGTLRNVDTPSLLGLAASAPYFHDGSAPTLEALLRDRGGVHGMADGALALDDGQVRDLTAFLETL